jgi:ligand-binding sensor domain-containing protein/signal transduction histidine kinase
MVAIKPRRFCHAITSITLPTLAALVVLVVLPCLWPACAMANAVAAATSGVKADFPFAQPYFEKVNDAHQITRGYISTLAQDARGFLWIGTQDGLIRYDGYRYRRFAYEPGRPGSLAGNYVETLLPLPDGRVWVGSGNFGLSLYDPATDQFENFQHHPKQADSLSAGAVRALVRHPHAGVEGVWIATDSGLDFLADQSRRFIHFQHQKNNPASLLDDHVQSLLRDRRDRRGRLWVGTEGGLQRLKADGKSFEPVLAGHDIRVLFEAKDGKLWFATSLRGAAFLDPDSLQVHWLNEDRHNNIRHNDIRHNPGSRAWIKTIAQVGDGQIWLGTLGAGIQIVAANDGHTLQQLRHDPALGSSLGFDEVSALLPERSGILWIGTRGGGIQRFNTKNQAFFSVRRTPHNPAGLSHSNIKCLLEHQNGQIWLGTMGNGIDILERQTGVIGGHRAQPGQAGALPDGSIFSLAQTRDGTVWAGTQQAGVVRLAPGQQAWTAASGLPATSVRRLFASRNDTLWAGLGQGIARWNARAQRFEIMPGDDGKPIRQSILSMAEDAQGRIWAGSNDGLWVWQPGSASFHAIAAEPSRPGGLISGYVRGLLLDQQQRLWLSTDKGLERLKSWDGKVAEFEHFSSLIGQPGSSAYGTIMQDLQGRIWGTRFVIDPVQMTVKEYDRADGFDVGATWLGGHAISRDGLLFQGGTLGLQVIRPEKFRAWNYQPPVVLSELKINGKAMPLGGLAQLQPGPLELLPGQRNFALEFTALDFSQPQKNLYRYRLLGYDKDWIEADFENRSASYGNLWPGDYTLQVRGSNRMGQWSRHELNIAIRILPAWYQTWWFGMALLGALLAGVGLVVQMRTRYLSRRQTELAHEVAQRTLELERKQEEILAANLALNDSNEALNHSNAELTLSIATLHHAQEQLVQQEKLASLGGLVAGIAHEMNTPLGTTLVAISGMGDAWRRLRDAVNQGRLSKSMLEENTALGLEYTELAERMTSKTAHLISTFKTIALPTEGDVKLDVDLVLFIPELVSLMRLAMEQAGHRIQVEVPEHLVVHIVPDALTEALTRILSNVIDHAFVAGQPGLVTVTVQAEALTEESSDKEVKISISDNGQGIAAADLPKVFDPFFTTKSGMHGHIGLGLHVAYNHVTQRLKGRIEITSSLGQGTTVTICLKA